MRRYSTVVTKELGSRTSNRLLPSERARCALARAKKLETLNAFTVLRENEILQEALEADKKVLRGSAGELLEGEIFGVKDNFCLRGRPTTCGSNMLKNFVPSYDATVVEKLKAAGGLILGKTNMDEFGMGSGCIDSIFGPVKNIWRSGIPYRLASLPTLNKGDFIPDTSSIDSGKDWFIAGGSSGGSASAVSAGICLAALGSDTGGSVRIPGSWSGLVSLKPTYGALSRHGLIPLVNSLDVPGILARKVYDVANLFNALAGQDHRDSTTLNQDKIRLVNVSEDPDISQLRVGIPAEYFCEDMSPQVVEAWSQVADLLEEHGVRVSAVSMPHTPYSITCYQVLNPCEVASNMARYDGVEYGLRTPVHTSTEALYADVRHHGFNYVVRGRILAGNYFLLREHYDEYFLKALKVRRLIQRDFENVWQKVDVLLTPATLTDAPSFSSFSQADSRTQTSKHDYCTQPVNMAGLPAATLPVKLSENSLPLSLQIIGQSCQEDVVLSLCKWLENRLNFPHPELIEFE